MRVVLVAAPVAAFALSARAEEKGDLAGKMKEAKVSLKRGSPPARPRASQSRRSTKWRTGSFSCRCTPPREILSRRLSSITRRENVAKAEPITGGDDLTAAKAQNEAMSKAKTPLQTAVSNAVKANKGYKAVSVVPSLKDGHPTADVTLLTGS